jgi:3-phosphoglycerate kinase
LLTEEVEAFWRGPGGRIERHLFAAATEVIAAYRAFAAAGLVASASDRHLVTEARRLLAADR